MCERLVVRRIFQCQIGWRMDHGRKTMNCYDAIVVGLGGMGSAAVAHLSARTNNVLGLEQYSPAHAKGSSHGQSRVIRQAYFEHPNYVPLLLRAYELWESLQSESADELIRITGGLMIGRPDSQTIQGSQSSAQQHGLPHEMLNATEIRNRFPELHPSDDLIALYESKAGYVRPENCILAHLARATKQGASLHYGESVIGWRVSPHRKTVLVETNKSTYETASLVLSPGAWAPRLFQLDIALEVVRQFLFWISPTHSSKLFQTPHFPIFIWEVDRQVQFYGFPQHGPDSDGIKMAIFYQHDPCEPEALQSEPSSSYIELIRKCLKTRIPNLTGPICKSVACMYTNTPDHHFVIGPHPFFENVIIASPCSGHGFKFCSVIGEVLCQLTLDGRSSHAIEMFSPKRDALQIGFPK